MADFDLAIIGGGITGTGIARDAAGRGIRVLLLEQQDLAAATSSASSKVVHGGLVDLRPRAVRRLRHALEERAVLLRLAPHLVRPMRFVLPLHPALHAAWRVRLGLFVSDWLGHSQILPATQVLDLTHGRLAAPLQRRYRLGFEYSGCEIDDSRLVVLNAIDAGQRGAVIRTRTRVVRAERTNRHWRLALKSRHGREILTARLLVSAAGPWTAGVAERVLRRRLPGPVSLVKGSHVVVRRRFGHDRGYLFAGGGGALFAMPYQGDFTLIGTTQEAFAAEPDALAPSAAGMTMLCAATRDYLRDPVSADEVVWAFAGLQALDRDGGRTAQIHLDAPAGEAPLLTVYGGTMISFRRLAERACARIAHYFSAGPAWTGHAHLPGGDFAGQGTEALVAGARARWGFLSEPHARRLVAAYGTRLDRILGDAREAEDLGVWFGGDLTAAELRYLHRHEWAQTADDVLWRRSKLGLVLRPEQQAAVARFMATDAAAIAPAPGSSNGDKCRD